MKKLISSLFILGIIAPFALFSVPSPSQPAAKKTQPSEEFVDQGDETDIYAVPLDTSEEEEHEESKELKYIQKELQQERSAAKGATAQKGK